MDVYSEIISGTRQNVNKSLHNQIVIVMKYRGLYVIPAISQSCNSAPTYLSDLFCFRVSQEINGNVCSGQVCYVQAFQCDQSLRSQAQDCTVTTQVRELPLWREAPLDRQFSLVFMHNEQHGRKSASFCCLVSKMF